MTIASLSALYLLQRICESIRSEEVILFVVDDFPRELLQARRANRANNEQKAMT